MNYAKFLVALLIAATLLAGCEKSSPVPVIRVVHANHDHHAALFVACKLSKDFAGPTGLFLKEKEFKKEYELYDKGTLVAKLVLSSASGGSNLVRKLAEDQADFALGGFPAEVMAMDDGAPIRVIAPLMMGGTGVVVRSDLPVGDWAGFADYAKKSKTPLRISYRTEGTTQLFAMRSALTESGVTFSEDLSATNVNVIFVNLAGSNNLVPGLQSKIIDGFIDVQPTLATAENLGAGKIVAYLNDFKDDEKSGLYPCCAIAARNSAIDAYPQAIEKLTTLIYRANSFITRDPKASAPVVAQWLGDEVAVEERSLPTIKYISCLDKDWSKSTDIWVNRMVKSGKLKGVVKKNFEEKGHLAAIYDVKMLDKAIEGCCK